MGRGPHRGGGGRGKRPGGDHSGGAPRRARGGSGGGGLGTAGPPGQALRRRCARLYSARWWPGAECVVHAGASAGGISTAIKCTGLEGTIVEMSWYGDKAVSAELGAAFHSRRLRLVSSQVGQVSASRRPRWDYRRRVEAAVRL